VEFPGSGADIERTVVVKVGGVSILMISCEGLYLDRGSVKPQSRGLVKTTSLDGALEIALTNYRTMVWGSETPSSSIPDLGVAVVPIVLAASTFAQVV
jgi:hypothetical protein